MNGKIKIPKLPAFKFFKDKRSIIINKPISVIVKKKWGDYYITLRFKEMGVRPKLKLQSENQAVGIDLGISHFAVTSDGQFIPNQKLFQKYEKQLRVEERSLSRKKKGSVKYKKQVQRLNKLYGKIANIRKDYLHKQSTKIANKYSVICLEDLQVSKMLQNGYLSRSIGDLGWRTFRNMLVYKSNVIVVPPAYTSQTCNKCGHVARENRPTQIKFHCIDCGHRDLADRNAARNIKELGLKLYYREAQTLV
jgi:putative transposase